ncbi:MAG: U32 family peptidase [Clostridia bacterium]|nr:U32 family peptidase [Clostridia bacterium]
MFINNKLPELLAPAGNMERLKAAFKFGADAVYLGAPAMSLRNFADNFTFEELKEACAYAHERGKKVYLACNSFAHNKDMETLPEILQNARECEVDALIVNDPGVIAMARRLVPEIELHLSTQANTLNSQAAAFWHEAAGIKRIVLARELTLKEIGDICKNAPEGLEFEAFVHGAMCISFSGRCLLSNYLTGRDSNKGECAQPCRWSYEIREKGKDGEYFPIVQDDLGTHILNSRDMMLIEHLPEVIASGVCSLKIEGRMKSVLYVSTVVNAYRMALDIYAESVQTGKPYVLPQSIRNELNMVSHRPYTTGFAFGDPGAQGQSTPTSKYVSDCEISAVVLEYDEAEKTALVRQRNRFFVGDTLSILAPYDVGRSFVVTDMVNDDGEHQQVAPHPNQHLRIPCEETLKPGDVLRKAK